MDIYPDSHTSASGPVKDGILPITVHAKKKGQTVDYEYHQKLPEVNFDEGSVDEIQATYNEQQRKWYESSTMNEYRTFFDSVGSHLKDKIDNICVFALGKLSPAADEKKFFLGQMGEVVPAGIRSSYQLAFVESLITFLPKVEARNVCFQDPSFRKADIAFLNSKGFSVEEVPLGYNRVTRTSLVYNACWYLASVHALKMSCPAMYIGGLNPNQDKMKHPEEDGDPRSSLDTPSSWATDNHFLFLEKAIQSRMSKITRGEEIFVYYLPKEYLNDL